MPSPQLHKLIAGFSLAGGEAGAGRAQVIAAYRRRIDDCAVIDGMAPTIAATTEIIRASAGGVPSEWVLAEGAYLECPWRSVLPF